MRPMTKAGSGAPNVSIRSTCAWPARCSASASQAWRTIGSNAAIFLELKKAARLRRTIVWKGGSVAPSSCWSSEPQVLGERLESPLHERGRVLGHGDDVVPPGQVEHAGHHLGDRIGLTQRSQHLEVVVHLSRFERVVEGRHP